MKRRRNPAPSRFLESVIDNDDDPLTITWIDAPRDGAPGDHDEWTLVLGAFGNGSRDIHLYHATVYWERGRWAMFWSGPGPDRFDGRIRGSKITMTDDELRRLGVYGRMVLGEMVERMRELLAKQRSEP